MVPVGALPAIAADFDVSEALIGTLLASYALVAALTTVPLVRLTAQWPRRRRCLLTLVCLTASQLISAFAPNFAVLAGGRVLCALTHGLMWSVIAPIGVRLVPCHHAGRATTAVYAGTSTGARRRQPADGGDERTVGLAAGGPCVVPSPPRPSRSRRWPTLPAMQDVLRRGVAAIAATERHHRNSRSGARWRVLTLVGVTGPLHLHTFIVVIIRDVVGVHGPTLAWLLAAFRCLPVCV